MMLTRDECEKALESLSTPPYESSCGGCICGISDCGDCPSNKANKVLNQLIDEHFDNPPLTLDELYEFVKQDTDYHYLPVWDNKFGGQWFVLENINGNKLKFKGYDHPIEFEEGRYYRKEVQECN